MKENLAHIPPSEASNVVICFTFNAQGSFHLIISNYINPLRRNHYINKLAVTPSCRSSSVVFKAVFSYHFLLLLHLKGC